MSFNMASRDPHDLSYEMYYRWSEWDKVMAEFLNTRCCTEYIETISSPTLNMPIVEPQFSLSIWHHHEDTCGDEQLDGKYEKYMVVSSSYLALDTEQTILSLFGIREIIYG